MTMLHGLRAWWLRSRRHPLSEVMNPARYEDPDWDALHRELEAYSVDKHVFRNTGGEIYRKGWEWTQCLYGLRELGMIRSDAKALGVGAGHEPVIFWLSDRIGLVIATDLYGNEAWSTENGAEAAAAVFTSPEQYCPRPIARENILFQNADGTKLPFADDAFDFCWSLSSIEHFGGHEAAATCMREMARVTRPGGVICVATELLTTENYSHSDFFTRPELSRYIIEAADSLSLVDGMRWRMPPAAYFNDTIVLPQDVHRLRRHVVLQDGNYQWTSVIVFLKKTSDQTAAPRSES
jgi:SAM-dependent methyltransferase